MRISYKYCLIIALAFIFGSYANAQAIVINAPVPADNPNLGGNSPWPAICAGNGGFNEYFVSISWIGTANQNNQFILELSNSIGDFTNPSVLKIITDQNNTKDFDVSFAIPTTTRGAGYKMRVRSTDPVKIGTASDAYNMYYMNITSNLNISELGDGTPPGSICSDSSVTLRVDNIASPETYQYIWYRSGTLLSTESESTITASESGMYSAFIDYGAICSGSGNTDSNIVDITIGTGGAGIAINTPSKTALCNGETETLTIAITDASWNYQWYLNNNSLVGENNASYIVNAANPNFAGNYAVEISGPTICTERSDAVTITNADSFEVTTTNAANLVLLPSQTQVLSVTTNANTPSYKWFRNTTEISGETSSTLTISQAGSYYAEVTQSGGNCGLNTKNSTVTTVIIPASFIVSIDYAAAYSNCTSQTTDLEVTLINAVASNGATTNVTDTMINIFDYQWQKDGVAISNETTASINIASNLDNGDYTLLAEVDSYNETSNALPVQLLTNETVVINSTSSTYCDGGETITISTPTDLTSATFEWLKDGATIATTGIALNVIAAGTYQLVVLRDGCPLFSNEIIITPLNDDLITLTPNGLIVIPEGTSKSITAEGGTAYRWMDENAVELSATNNLDVTIEGIYTLIATIGTCEVVKQFTVSYLDTFKVPNVITVNGDGINDQWVIPNSYSNKPDINIIIYNAKGAVVFDEFDYKNNWPQTNTAFGEQNMVFYYKIKDAKNVLKKGTITVIR